MLETTSLERDDTMSALEEQVASGKNQAELLTEKLDPDALRSAVDSVLNIVSRRMTPLAQAFPLEHSEHGFCIDPNRLTVVADTLHGPA
ncbi:hypothetical protein ACTHQS_09430 [Arthrobacter sp. SAFR-044]